MSNLHDLVKEFFKIVDVVECSDGGNYFHPTKFDISTCRVLDGARLVDIIRQMKILVGVNPRMSEEELYKLNNSDGCFTCLGTGRIKKSNICVACKGSGSLDPAVCRVCRGTGDTANHERYSEDCYLCKTSGRVKPCTYCNGTGENNDDIYNQGKECIPCEGHGVVADKDY